MGCLLCVVEPMKIATLVAIPSAQENGQVQGLLHHPNSPGRGREEGITLLEQIQMSAHYRKLVISIK